MEASARARRVPVCVLANRGIVSTLRSRRRPARAYAAAGRDAARLGLLHAGALGLSAALGGRSARRVCHRQQRRVRCRGYFSRRSHARIAEPDLVSERILEDSAAIQLRPRPGFRRRTFRLAPTRIPTRRPRAAQILKDKYMKRLTELFFLVCVGFAAHAHAKLNVVATTPDFAAFAREIGGDKIDIVTLARATEDPHFVDAKPSFVVKLNRADALLEGGAELEA